MGYLVTLINRMRKRNYRCASATPERAQDVLLLLVAYAGMGLGILMHHEEEGDAPNGADGAKHVED